MIPFLIAGAVGFGIAKLLEKDTKKFAGGGEVNLLSDKFTEAGYDTYARNFGVASFDDEKNISILVSANLLDMYDATGEEEFEEKPFVLILETHAYPEFWSDEYAEKIKDMVGDDTINPRTIDYLSDAHSYGLGVPLSTYADGMRFKTEEEAIKFLNSKKLNDQISGLGFLSGFHFDKYLNRIGDTGWKYLSKQVGANYEEYAEGGEAGSFSYDYYEVYDESTGKSIMIYAIDQEDAESIAEELDFESFEDGDEYNPNEDEYAEGGEAGEKYNVVKVFRKSGRREILEKNLTLEEARRVVSRYPNSNTSMVVFMKMYANGGEANEEKPYQVYNQETSNVEGYFDNEIEAEEFASQFKNASVYDIRQYAEGGKLGAISKTKIEITENEEGDKIAKRTLVKENKDGEKITYELEVGVFKDRKKGYFEIYASDEEDEEYFYAEGGLWIEGGRVVDYDGVYELSEKVRPLLSALNLNSQDIYAEGGQAGKKPLKSKIKKKDPKIVRQYFEDRPYSYAKGGEAGKEKTINSQGVEYIINLNSTGDFTDTFNLSISRYADEFGGSQHSVMQILSKSEAERMFQKVNESNIEDMYRIFAKMPTHKNKKFVDGGETEENDYIVIHTSMNPELFIKKHKLTNYNFEIDETDYEDFHRINFETYPKNQNFLKDKSITEFYYEPKETYAKGGSVSKGYNVFNYTDNIYATDEVFKTKKLANDFIREFRNKFSKQGYYRDNQMNKIDVKDIDLLAIPSDFNPFGKTI